MKYSQSSAVYYNYSLEYAISNLAKLGYDGIEIWGGRPHMYRKDLDDQTKKLKNLLDEKGMEVCNIIPAQFRYPSLLCSLDEAIRRDSIGYIKDAMDNAHKMGAPSVSLCPGMLPWDQDLERGWEALRNSFFELHEINKEMGLLLLIEPAHRFETNLILPINDALKMINELDVNDFGVLLDTGHCHVNGEKFEEVIPACSNYPLHIHLDDNNGDIDAHLVPGEGTVDFTSLAKELNKIGYNGYMSAELGTKYIMDPNEACRQSLQEMRLYFDDIG
ncbi:MAG: sugar phosphate isomerase/epimerase [Bacteroidales bacterium]|jgi:protein FrlC|nr:sugar phosphate isomerase/epimerase [Bacteroidales bacterium]